jgi:hypothetical protein
VHAGNISKLTAVVGPPRADIVEAAGTGIDSANAQRSMRATTSGADQIEGSLMMP